MCLKAVVNEPDLIRDVPLEILNQQFLNDLQLLKVEIPSSLNGYLQKCLNIHKSLESTELKITQNCSQETINEEVHLNDEISQINLNSFEWLLTPPALNKLKLMGITTIGDLLMIGSSSKFLNRLDGDRHLKLQILGAIRLLRCKYLDEDPLIDENDNIDISIISEKFGFSKRTRNCLGNARFNSKRTNNKFFKLMRNYEMREYLLSRESNIGPKVISEIIYKVQIVLDYHDRHQKNTKYDAETNLNDNLSLEDLNKELLRLKIEMQRLTERTDVVLEQIRQRMLEQSKGNVSK